MHAVEAAVDSDYRKEEDPVTVVTSNFDTDPNNPSNTPQPASQDEQTVPPKPPEEEHTIIVNITPCQNARLFFNLTLRSLGVIFGDIGTSPLYVLSTIFDFQPTEAQCIGALSLVIWSLIVLVTIKYSIFILKADNYGEGGTFALCGLLTSDKSFLSPTGKKIVIIVSLLAGSLLIGDGALTPAVSVLSAVEGIAVEAPSMKNCIVPITIVILVLLFLAQHWGTSKIGVTFGPIMCIWFASLFSIGVWRITIRPNIMKAFNPWEAFHYLLVEQKTGFYQIGGVFLAVTGLETLYADLGHFGRWPVRSSWFFIVFPAVLFNYLGQGALLISDPSLVDSPFYHAVPDWGHWPMVVLATLATIIASQAIITGSYSLISQAIGMECSVPFTIRHTSKKVVGQIYIPAVNYILLILTIAVVAGFQTGSNITNAYGVTVCTVMVITTVLFMLVLHYRWRKPWYLTLPFGIFIIIDLYTWSANAVKIPDGGWVALLIGACTFILGFCWYFGQVQLHRFLRKHAQTTSLHVLPMRLGLLSRDSRLNSQISLSDIPVFSPVSRAESDNISCSDSDSNIDFDTSNDRHLPKTQSFVQLIHNVSITSPPTTSFNMDSIGINPNDVISAVVTPGVACFLTTSKKHTPHVFESFLAHMHSIPQVIVFLKVEHSKRAIVNNDQRLTVKMYGDNIYHITAVYGYCENRIKPFEVLMLARTQNNVPIPHNEFQVTVFAPNEAIRVSTIGWRSWIRRWPLYVYSFLKSLYPGAAVNLELNPQNTINIGILADLD